MTFSEGKAWLARNNNVVFFVGGFLFDALTLVRIDSVLDLLLQSAYLGLITFILIRQVRVEAGHWQPSGWIARLWKYETEAIHFLYGGLLSAYVIFYFKSTTGPRSMVFLVLTILLMFANEMPQIKEAGSRMRLGLHAFCLVSFLNYLIPVVAGKMGWWTFMLAVLLSAGASNALVRHLAKFTDGRPRALWNLSWPPLAALLVISSLYVLKWIPPVPLSVQYAGVFHQIRKENGVYALAYPKPPWYRFWQKDSSPFYARPGDVVYCFARIFAPRRFTHEVYMRWQHQAPSGGLYRTADLITIPIYGGRGEGFRGYGSKFNYSPGQWKVNIETSDARVIGSLKFEIRPDPAADERVWRMRRM